VVNTEKMPNIVFGLTHCRKPMVNNSGQKNTRTKEKQFARLYQFIMRKTIYAPKNVAVR